MPATFTDMGLYQSAVMGADFTTTSVGGAVSVTPITVSSVAGVFFTMAPEAAGGSNKVQYEKIFGQNDAAAGNNMTEVKWWLDNALDDWPALDYPTITFATADATKKARFIGFNSSGAAIQSEVALSATSNTAADQFNASNLDRVEIRDVASPSALVAIHETGTVKQSATEVGFVPGPINISPLIVAGRWSATAEVDIGLASAINDTATTGGATTAADPPTGVTFTRPRQQATQDATVTAALSTPGGTLTPTDAIGIWLRLTVKPGAKTSADIQHVLGFRIQAA